MTIIKIDSKTVHKNPRAGCTTTKVLGNQTCTFEFKEEGQIPPHLLQHCEIAHWCGSVLSENGSNQAGYILNPDDVEKFFDVPGISIECKREYNTIRHAPEPEWLYKWEDVSIPCDSCRHQIQYKDLENHTTYGEYVGGSCINCPNCNEIDTFKYEYETIEEYFKRNNL